MNIVEKIIGAVLKSINAAKERFVESGGTHQKHVRTGYSRSPIAKRTAKNRMRNRMARQSRRVNRRGAA